MVIRTGKVYISAPTRANQILMRFLAFKKAVTTIDGVKSVVPEHSYRTIDTYIARIGDMSPIRLKLVEGGEGVFELSSEELFPNSDATLPPTSWVSLGEDDLSIVYADRVLATQRRLKKIKALSPRVLLTVAELYESIATLRNDFRLRMGGPGSLGSAYAHNNSYAQLARALVDNPLALAGVFPYRKVMRLVEWEDGYLGVCKQRSGTVNLEVKYV